MIDPAKWDYLIWFIFCFGFPMGLMLLALAVEKLVDRLDRGK